MAVKKPWGAEIQNRKEMFELKRQAVLATAARMIRSRGFEKTTLGTIADELNVAKPTVYYYFRNKDEIVANLMDMATGELLNPEIHPEDFPNIPGLNGAQRLERLLCRCVRLVMSDVGSSILMVYPHHISPEMQNRVNELSRPVDEMIKGILDAGREDGSLAACDVTAVFLLIVGALRYVPVWADGLHRTPEQVTDTFVSLVLNGLRKA